MLKSLFEIFMKFRITLLFSLLILLLPLKGKSQINEDQMGAWYMYFWNTSIKEGPFGFQGDIQHRNWNILGDLEQLLLRGGLTYVPNNTSVKFTLGCGYVLSGEFGDGTATTQESRIYQEALVPQKIGGRTFITHRFRYEQRFVEDQDFRTRYRYNLFITVPFNQPDLSKGAIYLAFYNELFINGQRAIGDSRTVEIFDRNRTYGALGYSLTSSLRTQVGLMRQVTDSSAKNQLQFSLHHTF